MKNIIIFLTFASVLISCSNQVKSKIVNQPNIGKTEFIHFDFIRESFKNYNAETVGSIIINEDSILTFETIDPPEDSIQRIRVLAGDQFIMFKILAMEIEKNTGNRIFNCILAKRAAYNEVAPDYDIHLDTTIKSKFELKDGEINWEIFNNGKVSNFILSGVVYGDAAVIYQKLTANYRQKKDSISLEEKYKGQHEAEIQRDIDAQEQRQPGSSSIGQTVKIGNLEIAEKDFVEKMTWEAAKKACADLGDGWRLPTKDELNILFENKDKIGGFSENNYWSSLEIDSEFALARYFTDKQQSDDRNNAFKSSTYRVRIVRNKF